MKTIEVDPFDIRSVKQAIAQLKRHETWRKQKITEYIKRLCEVGAQAARETYRTEKVSVSVTPDGKGIIAQGGQVMFIEFGAGLPTTDHEELSSTLSISIEPGSWSMSPDGTKTWKDVLDGKVSPENYKYNRTPRPGMWAAYRTILAEQARIANEVFNRD